MTSVLGALLLAATPLPAASIALQLPARRSSGEYYWPEPRGRPESYGVSPYAAPRFLTNATLAWTWFLGGPEGKYSQAAHSGLLIDDQKSIYLASTDGVRKLSSEGQLLWYAPLVSWRLPTIADGKLYTTDNSGKAYALSMETGERLWEAHFTDTIGMDISSVAVFDGVLIATGKAEKGGGSAVVAGLSADDGGLLWEFRADSRLWNTMPMTTGNGTFIFQDQVGGVYHLRTQDGHQLWKAGYSGPWARDFTDGLAMVKDGVVYAVHSDGDCCFANQPASVRAYDLASGAELWMQRFPHPVNSQPVVGHLGKGVGLSDRLVVVVPIGAQPVGFTDSFNTSIGVFDAKTGEPVWEWVFPTWHDKFVAGDAERQAHGTLCLPNPYGSPSIDARGTLYVGHLNGKIYAIRDDSGDGAIQDSEVSRYDTGAGFSHGGAALAPGMLAIPSCDGVYVFKE